MKRLGGAAAQPGRENDSPGRRITSKNTTARRSSKNGAALAELARLFTPPAQWVVAIRKENGGAIVVFSVADCEADAESTCARLRAFGLDARAELIRDKIVSPGMTIGHASVP